MSVYTHTSVVVFTVHDAHVTSIALVLSFAIHSVCIYNSIITHSRAKHPVKVHVWAGISVREGTGVCIFEGLMDSLLYLEILEKTLIPFLYEGSW